MEISDIKGPFMTDLKNIKMENEALLRELKSTQSINREMYYD